MKIPLGKTAFLTFVDISQIINPHDTSNVQLSERFPRKNTEKRAKIKGLIVGLYKKIDLYSPNTAVIKSILHVNRMFSWPI